MENKNYYANTMVSWTGFKIADMFLYQILEIFKLALNKLPATKAH